MKRACSPEKKSRKADLSSLSDEHFTPEWLVELARSVLGRIDLDPCSCAEAQQTIQAERWFDRKDDGLKMVDWFGNVYCNPPGGQGGRLVKRFWDRLWLNVDRGNVPAFVWLAFNHAQLRTLQPRVGECAICVLRRRLRFTGPSPTRDNAVLYYGPAIDRFAELFSPHGCVWTHRAMEEA